MRFRSAEYWDVLAKLRAGERHPLVQRHADRARRRPHRHRPRLRPGDRQGPAEPRRGAPQRGRRPRAGRPPRRPPVQGHPRRGEALPAPALPAVHHLDPAAGVGPQAAAVLRADDAGRPAALRERLHHLHANRLGEPVRVRDRRRAAADPGPLRGRRRSAAAPPVHRKSQERPGGARGHPPRRGHLPHARRGRQGTVGRGVPALRADLAADHRVADDRRGRQQHLGADQRGHRGARSRATSARPARRSPTPASCGPTWSPPTTRRPRPRTPSAGCRCWSRTSR